jgi:hypothetical protein
VLASVTPANTSGSQHRNIRATDRIPILVVARLFGERRTASQMSGDSKLCCHPNTMGAYKIAEDCQKWLSPFCRYGLGRVPFALPG